MRRDQRTRCSWRRAEKTLRKAMLAAAALAAAGPVCAQGVPASPPAAQNESPVFRTGTKLVEVTVTVRDKKGQAVAGLAASDFMLQDNGKPRPVAFFRFDGAPAAPATGQNLSQASVFTNRGASAGAGATNATALVLDSINTSPQGSIVARAQMMRYLKALAPQMSVAIFHMGHELRILHDFTDDAASLRSKLDKAILWAPLEETSDFQSSVVEAEQFVEMFKDNPVLAQAAEDFKRMELRGEMRANAAARRSRLERSLAAIEALGQHVSGIPGRKNIVWITAGFAMVSIVGRFGTGANGGFDSYEGLVQETARRLAQQGVVLYIVNAEGLTGPPNANSGFKSPPPAIRARNRFERESDAERVNYDPNSTMELMAGVTGGRYLHDTNDLASGFRQTVADLRGSYTLGFYMPEEPDGRWHKLKVRVNRSGVSARHREGYIAEAAPPQPPEWDDAAWQAAFSNPLGSSAVPLTAKRQFTPAGELILDIVAESGSLDFRRVGENLAADLKIGLAEKTAAGSAGSEVRVLKATVPPARWEAARNQGVAFRKQWMPGPESIVVRVVVLDLHTGRYGSLDVPLKK